MTGVLPIIKHNSGCDYHRIINPMMNLGFDVMSVPKKSSEELMRETKILFFNRGPENPADKVLEYRKKYGFKIVLDLDDYWELNINHPMYKTWITNKLGEDIFGWVKNADAITCTTARLADKIIPHNKNVHIIPNALPYGEGQFNSIHSESNFTRFIYTGGESHVRDIDILKIPFSKLINVPNAQFILAGYSSRNTAIWDKMERSFTVNGKIKNYERREFKPLDSYMNLYTNSDVLLIPLEYNIFTPYKSNIKFLEAGCKYMPVICSNVPPYSDEPNKDIAMYAGNVREWVHWITYCYKNPNFVKEKGQQMGEYVRKHFDLTKVNEYRTQLFNHLMS
jgi:glycosyltransferase involved in cell wall biosynthesis